MLRIENIGRPRGMKREGKRCGRGIGSGKGKTSGRGHKGANARSGSGGRYLGFEGGQMPLMRRMPKRGFTNIFKKEWNIINLRDLDKEKKIKDGSTIDKETLAKLGVIKKKSLRLKVLGTGKIGKALTVKADAFSESASQAIQTAGGKAERI